MFSEPDFSRLNIQMMHESVSEGFEKIAVSYQLLCHYFYNKNGK